jgi:hypothetical protein
VVALQCSMRHLMVMFNLLGGGGGGGDHMTDPVLEESMPASLALILGARVLMGSPHGLIQIHAICLYAGYCVVESGTSMTSTGSSSSSTSAIATSTMLSSSMTSSSPSLIPGDDNTGCLCLTEYGHGPIPWMAHGVSQRPHRGSARSEGSIGL